MAYRVIEFFTDLEDGDHPYMIGDTYPREGLKPSSKRIKELSSNDNKRGMRLIEAVETSKNKK